ncbi:MAG TPA: hypothetical protein VFV38_11835 [Ktedonobacteraceae bacterium]|nr:hypothetical protein [Ktedonobacteraceae bacterium]
MSIINIRNTVRAHLFRERFEVFLAVMIPFVFMIESGYACGWIFAGGHLGLDALSAMSFARGFGIEALVFVCFKLVRVFFLKGMKIAPCIPFLVGVVAMIVSAGMNLGFMTQSPEMAAAMASVGHYLPAWMTNIFKIGLGLLFPVGVALFALFDVRHLVDEMIASAHLDETAFIVQRAEAWRTNLSRATKQAINKSKERLQEIADSDADNMVQSIKSGDMSFGMNKIKQQSSSVVKVSPAAPAMSHRPNALSPMPPLQQLPPLSRNGSSPKP